jgi:hypothetical protein
MAGRSRTNPGTEGSHQLALAKLGRLLRLVLVLVRIPSYLLPYRRHKQSSDKGAPSSMHHESLSHGLARTLWVH